MNILTYIHITLISLNCTFSYVFLCYYYQVNGYISSLRSVISWFSTIKMHQRYSQWSWSVNQVDHADSALSCNENKVFGCNTKYEVVLRNCLTEMNLHILLPVLVSGDIGLLDENFLEVSQHVANKLV